MLLNLIKFEWKYIRRDRYNWILPLSFFTCTSILFIWIPGNNSTIHNKINIWISLFFSITIANKDSFLLPSTQEIISLWSNLKIPKLYIFWSKWINSSLTSIMSFLPIFIFFFIIIGKNKYEFLYYIHLLITTSISITIFNLINLSVECLFTGKLKKSSPLLSPIISMPLSIPSILLSIKSSYSPIFSNPFILLIALFLFLTPILSWTSSNAIFNCKK